MCSSNIVQAFQSQPKEIQIQILSLIPISTLRCLSMSSKYFEQLSSDDELWKALFQKEYGTIISKDTWRQTFIHQWKIGNTIIRLLELIGHKEFLNMFITNLIKCMTIDSQLATQYKFEFSEDEIDDMRANENLVETIYKRKMTHTTTPPDPYKLYILEDYKFNREDKPNNMIHMFVERQYDKLSESYPYQEVRSVQSGSSFSYYMLDKLRGSNSNMYTIEYDPTSIEDAIKNIPNVSLKEDFERIMLVATQFAVQINKLRNHNFLLDFLKTPIPGLYNLTVVNSEEPCIDRFVHNEVNDGTDTPLTIFETGEQFTYKIQSQYISLYDILVGVMSLKSSKEDFYYELISGVESFDLETQTLVLQFANGT